MTNPDTDAEIMGVIERLEKYHNVSPDTKEAARLLRSLQKERTTAIGLLREAPVVLPPNAYVGDWAWRRDAFLNARNAE